MHNIKVRGSCGVSNHGEPHALLDAKEVIIKVFALLANDRAIYWRV